jgi:hypothetical protein
METLQELWKLDQMERKSFDEYYQLNNRQSWNDAIDNYKQLNKIPQNKNVFTDYTKPAKKIFKKIKHKLHVLTREEWFALWGLAMHADSDVNFQRKVFAAIKKYKYQHTHPKGYAYQYLKDRILINRGKPQRYGTQNANF